MTTDAQVKASDTQVRLSIYKVHLCVFMYSCAVGLAVPVIPFITEELGADTIVFGYLQTVFSIFQVIGSPLMGYIGDKYGSKRALILSYAACSVNYLILGSADSIPLLFLSRVPSLFQHGFLASQAYISEITPEGQRAHHLGRISFSFGVGFILGPTAGGLLASYTSSYSAVAFFASFVSFATMLVVIFYMDNHPRPPSAPAPKVHFLSTKKLAKLMFLFKKENVMPYLILRVLVSFPSALFDSMFPIIAKSHFKLDAKMNGFLMSYVGCLMALVQGLLVGFVSRHWPDSKILVYSTLLKCLSYFCLSFVDSIFVFAVAVSPVIISGALLNTIVNSALTKAVASTETGKILGIAMSVSSACRVVSPTVGGYFYFSFDGFSNFMLINGAIMMGSTLYSVYVSKLKTKEEIGGGSVREIVIKAKEVS